VQIAGADPALLADAARHNVAHGAEVIDINMGCPAKKVCSTAAGSALMSDEALIARILDAVVAAVDVPVTLKMRTGPDPAHRNAPAIARLAEAAGIAALTVHGRTRACMFTGAVEYETIAAVKASVTIPVIANGDIDSPERARDVLARTGADAIMIGRAAQGRPWIFREIAHFLATGRRLPPPTVAEARELILVHLADHYAFHGEAAGVRIARKHLGWYVRDLPGGGAARAEFNVADTTAAQLAAAERFFDRLAQVGDRLQYASGGSTSAAATRDPGVDGAEGQAVSARAHAQRQAATPWAGEALAA